MSEGEFHDVRIAVSPVPRKNNGAEPHKICVRIDRDRIIESGGQPFEPLLTGNGLWVGFIASTCGEYERHFVENVVLRTTAPCLC